MRIGITTSIATAIAIGVLIASGGGGNPPVPGLANLWVDTNGGTCARSVTAIDYVDATACATFDDAYQAASLGDAVGVRAGTYPLQTILTSAGKTAAGDAADVTFTSDGTVTVAGLQFGVRDGTLPPKHLTIDGNNTTWVSNEINFFDPDTNNPPTDITITNLLVRQTSGAAEAGIYMRGTDRVTFRDVEIGPACCGADGMQINNLDGGSTNRAVTNTVLDGVYMHDIVRACADLPAGYTLTSCSDDAGAHIDCIQFWSAETITISNSRFYNCATQSLAPDGENGGNFSNWTVENNMLSEGAEAASGIFAIVCSTPCVSGTWHVYHNSLANNIHLTDNSNIAGGTVFEAKGNIIVSQNECFAGIVYAQNLTTEGTCDASETQVADPGFVSTTPTLPDLHITAGSAANSAVTTCFVNRDLDGAARTLGAVCDAGADER